jgi:hypothetical protein
MQFMIWSVVLSLLSYNAFGGQGTITGKERGNWDTGYYNVIIAVIRDVQKDHDENPNRYRALCVPKAALAGSLDPSLYPALPVVFYVGKTVGSIEDLPRDGALVIAVLQLERTPDAKDKASAFIFSDICTFMPGESAMVVIKGLDDPRVAETLKKLQDARANPDPDPNRGRKRDTGENGTGPIPGDR